MSSSFVLHPEDARLLSFADGELGPAEKASLEAHLSNCEWCRSRVAGILGALQAIDAHHREFVKPSLPPPPELWSDLRNRMHELDAGRVLIRKRPPLRVYYRGAAAAAGILVAVFLYKMAGERTVSAAELLQQASARVQPAPGRRIQVKTRSARFTRPANASVSTEHAELAAWFKQANFSWEDPLNPRSFSAWRDRLSEKDDQVKILDGSEYGEGRHYRITTATSEGALARASITIRAADLRAVHESLHFRNNETVEIAEAPPEPAADQPRVPPGAATAEVSPRAATASDELAVVAALHRIGADLGEPVEIRREGGRVIVTATAASVERQQQIEAAIGQFAFVQLQFEDAQPVRPSTSPESAGGPRPAQNAIQSHLITQLGGRIPFENFVESVLSASEGALVRAHALRALAARFGKHVESELSVQDREKLRDMRADHTRRLSESLEQLSRMAEPVAGPLLPLEPRSHASWQDAAQATLTSAQELDRLLSSGLAGDETDDPARWIARVRKAIAVARSNERESGG